MPCRCNSASVASASQTDKVAGVSDSTTSCGCTAPSTSPCADDTAVLGTGTTRKKSKRGGKKPSTDTVAGTSIVITVRPSREFWPGFILPITDDDSSNKRCRCRCRCCCC